jgi:hypothetical protein
MATQAKLKTLADKVQGLRQARDSALKRLEEVCHRRNAAFHQPMSPIIFNCRGETAVIGANASTWPFSGIAGRRARTVSEAGEIEAGIDHDESPPSIETPASKRLFNGRKDAGGGSSDHLGDSQSVQVHASDGYREVSTIPMKHHATPATREKRREKYLLGKTKASLKPGLA